MYIFAAAAPSRFTFPGRNIPFQSPRPCRQSARGCSDLYCARSPSSCGPTVGSADRSAHLWSTRIRPGCKVTEDWVTGRAGVRCPNQTSSSGAGRVAFVTRKPGSQWAGCQGGRAVPQSPFFFCEQPLSIPLVAGALRSCRGSWVLRGMAGAYCC